YYRITSNQLSGTTFVATLDVSIGNVSDNKSILELMLVDNAGNVSINSLSGIEFRRNKPKDPFFTLSNPNNGSTMYSNTLNVSVNCVYSGDPSISWNITFNNIEARPSDDPSLWGAFPSTFLIPAASQGVKKVYLWAKNEAGINLNPVSASIIYDSIKPIARFDAPQGRIINYGEYGFIINIEDAFPLAKNPTVSIVFPSSTNAINVTNVSKLKDFIYSAVYDFTETSVNGIITINLEMIDMAGNVSTRNDGLVTLNLQIHYPEPPQIRFSQIDDVRRDTYINTLNRSILFWLAVTYDETGNNNTNKYLVEYTNKRPKANDQGWQEVRSSRDTTDVIYANGDVSTWDIKRLNVNYYLDVVSKYGQNGQRFLTTDIYVWVKTERNEVSEIASVWRLIIDVDSPIDTVKFNYLDDSADQRITFNISIDEMLTSNNYWIEFAYNLQRPTIPLTIGLGTLNFTLTANLTTADKSLHPVLRRILVDMAGNTLNAFTELQPKLYIDTIKMSTNTANRRDEYLHLLDIDVSPSSVVTLSSFSLEKIGDKQHLTVKKLYFKINEQLIDTREFLGTGDIRFMFDAVKIVSRSVLSLYGDIQDSAIDPFAFKFTSSSFVLGEYNRVSSNILTHTTNYYVVGNGWNVLHVYRDTSVKLTPNIAYQRDQDVVVFTFEMNSYPYVVELNKLVFNRNSNSDLSVGGLANVRLYYEDADSGWNDVFDSRDPKWLQLMEGVIDPGLETITFKGFKKFISSKKIRIFVVADISNSALPNKSISLEFRNSSNFGISELNIINDSTMPLLSDVTQLGNYRQRMNIQYVPLQAGEIHQGVSMKLGQLVISNDYYSTNLSQLNLRVSFNNWLSLGSNFFSVSSDGQTSAETVWINNYTKSNIMFNGPYTINSSPKIMGFGVNILEGAATGAMEISLYPSDLSALLAPAMILNTADITIGKIIIVDSRQPIISGGRIFNFINRPDFVTFDLNCFVKDQNTYIDSVQVELFSFINNSEHYIDSITISLNSGIISNSYELKNITIDKKVMPNLALIHGYQYLIKARAKSSNSNLSFSSSQLVLTFNVDLTSPRFPESAGLLLYQLVEGEQGVTSDIHRLSWPQAQDQESGVSYYTIEFQRGTSQKWNFETMINATTYTIADREREYRYRYRINAFNGARLTSDWLVSDYSRIAKKNDLISNLSFYPNPVNAIINEKGTFYYELSEDSNVSIKIYDALGHFVRELTYKAGDNGGSSTIPNKVEWDALDAAGRKVSKGGYFVVVNAVSESMGAEGVMRLMVGVIH
ncbi:MAG: FlgD immunoglobulin-like domain containing protein, partial [Candidatus Riflemargulisbacteria bacterium]